MAYTPVLNPANRPNDLSPEAYGGVGGSIANQTLASQWDIYSPQDLMDIVERHSHAPSYRMTLAAMGFRRGASGPTPGHYEAVWKKDNITVGQIITPSNGAGNTMIIELPAGEMFTPGLTANGGAVKASYPIASDELHFPGGVMARVMSKNVTTDPHRLTLKPAKSTIDLDDYVEADMVAFISSNSHGEGTGLPAGRTSRLVKYSNQFQISKAYAGATGSELTNKAYVRPIPGKEGSFYLKVENDMFYRMEDNVSGALIWGQIKTGMTEYNAKLGHDVPITGTEGLIEYTSTNSVGDTYVPTSYAVEDFDAIARYYEDERIGSRELLTHDGFDLYQEKENVLLDLFSGDTGYFLTRQLLGYTSEVAGQHQPFQNDWFGNIGFRGFRKSGYSFFFKLMHEFNEIKGAGAEGFDYRKWSIIVPLGYATNRLNGQSTPSVGYEYKKLNDYSREFVVGKLAGIGVAGAQGIMANAVHEYDVLEVGIVSEQATHFACANHILVQKP